MRSGCERRSAEGALQPGARVPSTRDLARQLGMSRNVVVNAYEQLAAEGYLLLAAGRATAGGRNRCRVGVEPERGPAAGGGRAVRLSPEHARRIDFPRAAWMRSMRKAIATMSDEDLGYGDTRGVVALRCALARYLGRVGV